MRSAAYVEEASEWAGKLVRSESRGPGDVENAMRRLEARYGIPFSAFWALRYRRPKVLDVAIYARLLGAIQAERERQIRLFQHERAITQAKTGLGAHLLRAADRLAGAQAPAVNEDKP